MKVTVSVYREKRGLGHPETRRLIRRAVSAALRAEKVDVPARVDVMLTDDEGIHEVNLAQRGVDSPTDVLSFPFAELTPGAFDAALCERDPGTGEALLGSMVIDLPRCEAQGEEYGHGYEREVSYLSVHSVLHLLGYDHLDEGPMKKQMRAREDAIMASLGITR